MFFVIKINDVLNIYNYDIEYFILNRYIWTVTVFRRSMVIKYLTWENYRIIINYNKFSSRMCLAICKIYYCICKFSKFLFYSCFKEIYIYIYILFLLNIFNESSSIVLYCASNLIIFNFFNKLSYIFLIKECKYTKVYWHV